MTVIAVAGGNGGLGLAIVEALVTTGQHHVIILTRDDMESKAGARLLAVDYDDVNRLTSVLEANRIEMVISTISPVGGFPPELNLIQAAEQSECTKRFIPSMWGNKLTEETRSSFYLAPGKLSLLAALDATSLEWTAVHTGIFMDYWLKPQIQSYLPSLTTAAIPGSGNVPVVFTCTSDIARYVARLVGLPKWGKDSFVVGDKVTWNEFLGFAEEATGSKFTVVVDTMDKLKSGQVSELPGHKDMYAFLPRDKLQATFSGVCRMCADGGFDFEASPLLAESFLDSKPQKVRESLLEAWKN
ncbi:NAD(P)-binding protein [Apiospora arundinis]